MQFEQLSHRAAHTQVITCMETLKKNVEEEDAVTSLVVGTESRYTSSPSCCSPSVRCRSSTAHSD